MPDPTIPQGAPVDVEGLIRDLLTISVSGFEWERPTAQRAADALAAERARAGRLAAAGDQLAEAADGYTKGGRGWLTQTHAALAAWWALRGTDEEGQG